ncbi:MAG: hypothetical protein R3C59_25140 [Planctomycetaceae bacterium]
MARIEADKEDLIRDATAFIHRGEFVRRPGVSGHFVWDTVTIGFRHNGSGTVYFDQDPFYQFDANGLLRRAFETGFLYRSQTHTLARLQRDRSCTSTILQRQDLTHDELQAFRERMVNHLQELLEQLNNSQLECSRFVSADGDLTMRSISFLQTVLQPRQQFLSESINQRA